MIPELFKNEDKFKTYFRVNITQFNDLLEEILPCIEKRGCIRKSMSPKERLCATLRYVKVYMLQLTFVTRLYRSVCCCMFVGLYQLMEIKCYKKLILYWIHIHIFYIYIFPEMIYGENYVLFSNLFNDFIMF